MNKLQKQSQHTQYTQYMSKGILHKMHTQLGDTCVQYSLDLGEKNSSLNSLVQKHITITHTGNIYCIECGCKTNKSFAQGYCYRCFTTSPHTEECVLHPELCQAHIGIARDMEYAQNHCLIPHYVYVAETSDLKIGVTRNTQIPTRWIDQGAIQACIIAQTPNRYTAGVIEVALKQYVADKTNWRKMLVKTLPEYDLRHEISIIQKYLHNYQEFLIKSEIQHITYPGSISSAKIQSVKLDTKPTISGILLAIKGQYLLFENGEVINIRSHGGYEVTIIE